MSDLANATTQLLGTLREIATSERDGSDYDVHWSVVDLATFVMHSGEFPALCRRAVAELGRIARSSPREVARLAAREALHAGCA